MLRSGGSNLNTEKYFTSAVDRIYTAKTHTDRETVTLTLSNSDSHSDKYSDTMAFLRDAERHTHHNPILLNKG